MAGRERLTTIAVRQLLHDAAAAEHERRRRSRRAESGLVSQPALSGVEGLLRGVNRSQTCARNRGRDDVGPWRRLRAVENEPSAARLTMRRRLGVCRTPVNIGSATRWLDRLGRTAPPPMGPAAGPFFACAVTPLARRPGPTSSRPRVRRRSPPIVAAASQSECDSVRHVLRSSAKPARSSADPDHRFTGTEKLIYAKAPAVRHRRHRPRSQSPACGAGR